MGMTAMVAGSVAGSAISSYQQFRAGQIEKKVSDQQAGLLEGDAVRATESAAEDARILRKRGRIVMGQQAAGYSASGVTLSGSPLLVMQETKAESELDAMKAEYGGQLQAKRLRDEAGYRRFAGKQAQIGGMIGAGTTLLTGGLGAFGQYKRAAQSQAIYDRQSDFLKSRGY